MMIMMMTSDILTMVVMMIKIIMFVMLVLMVFVGMMMFSGGCDVGGNGVCGNDDVQWWL